MEFTFELTEEDYIAFTLYHNEHSPSQKKMSQLLRYVFPFVFAIPIYLIGVFVFQQSSIYWIIVASLFVIGYILTYPSLYKKSLVKQSKKLLSEGDNASLLGKKEIKIDKETVYINSNGVDEKIPKANIVDIKVTDEMIILYLSSVSAHIIPIRSLDIQTYKKVIKELNI